MHPTRQSLITLNEIDRKATMVVILPEMGTMNAISTYVTMLIMIKEIILTDQGK